jgi:hypothetical protein
LLHFYRDKKFLEVSVEECCSFLQRALEASREWFIVFWSKNICPTDIWLINIWLLDIYLADQHLADGHLANGHVFKKLYGN